MFEKTKIFKKTFTLLTVEKRKIEKNMPGMGHLKTLLEYVNDGKFFGFLSFKLL